MNYTDILLKEYGVETEEELNKKMAEDALTLPCIICEKEKPIDELDFHTENPVCKECLRDNNVKMG